MIKQLALGLLLAAPACKGDDWVPSTVVSSGPVVLKQRVRFAIVAHDDPILSELADEIRGDREAFDSRIRVETDTWRTAAGNVESIAIVGESKAALASYIGEAIARNPRLKPPPGGEFVYDDARLYLVDTSQQMVIERVLGVRSVADDNPRLEFELEADDKKRFGELTGNNVGRKMVILVSTRVEGAPVILEAIRGGHISVSAGMQDGEAPQQAVQRLKDELIGG